MKIPFGTMSITEKSKELINEILESKRVSSGKYVKEFEKKIRSAYWHKRSRCS